MHGASMKLVTDAPTLKNLISSPTTVVFVVIGNSVNANTLAGNASHGEGNLGALTHVVAQVNPASIVDDPLLDPELRDGALTVTSADIGCSTGQTVHCAVFAVRSGDPVDLGTTTEAWITGDAN